jgi:hypothetical protein
MHNNGHDTMSNTYNGWTNRATWLVNVWFNPESASDVCMARIALEDAADAVPDYLRDFLCLDEVNWSELAAHFEDDAEDDAA